MSVYEVKWFKWVNLVSCDQYKNLSPEKTIGIDLVINWNIFHVFLSPVDFFKTTFSKKYFRNAQIRPDV